MTQPSDLNFDAFLNRLVEELNQQNKTESVHGTEKNDKGSQKPGQSSSSQPKPQENAPHNASEPSNDPDPSPPLPVNILDSAVCKQAYGRDEVKRSNILLQLERFHQNNDPRLYHKSTLAGFFVLTNPLKLHDSISAKAPAETMVTINKESLKNATRCLQLYFTQNKQGGSASPLNASSPQSGSISYTPRDLLGPGNVFERFITRYTTQAYNPSSTNWQFRKKQIESKCSSFLNVTDVFATCKRGQECLPGVTGRKLFRPHVMAKELAKYTNVIQRLDAYIDNSLSLHKAKLSDRLMTLFPSDRRMVDRIMRTTASSMSTPRLTRTRRQRTARAAPLTSDGATTPSGAENNTNSHSVDTRRQAYERRKKQKQAQWKKVLQAVTSKGRIKNAYKDMFTMETPFEMTRRAGEYTITADGRGTYVRKYDRHAKKMHKEIRLKADTIAEITNRFDRAARDSSPNGRMASVARGKFPRIDKPLRVVQHGSALRVTAGGDRYDRARIALWGLYETRQQFSFTLKSFKLLEPGDVSVEAMRQLAMLFKMRNRDTWDVDDNGNNANAAARFIEQAKSPSEVITFRSFPKREMEEVLDNVLLTYIKLLSNTYTRAKTQNQEVELHINPPLLRDRRLDIPVYRVEYHFTFDRTTMRFSIGDRYEILFTHVGPVGAASRTARPPFAYRFSLPGGGNQHGTENNASVLSYDQAHGRLRAYVRSNPRILHTRARATNQSSRAPPRRNAIDWKTRLASWYMTSGNQNQMSPLSPVMNLIREREGQLQKADPTYAPVRLRLDNGRGGARRLPASSARNNGNNNNGNNNKGNNKGTAGSSNKGNNKGNNKRNNKGKAGPSNKAGA